MDGGSDVTPDDGVLDDLRDVVEEVLGEDLPVPEVTDPWQRRQQRLDSWTAVILGVAALLTAWASFQASEWSGAQADAESQSAISRSDAGRTTTDATQAEIIDAQTWQSWLLAVSTGAEARARFLQNRFSPPLAAAQEQWLEGVTVGPDGLPSTVPEGTPMDLAVYITPARIQANAYAAAAERQLADAGQAATNSTRFVLLVVLFALVLFFASVSTKFSSPKVQALLMLVSVILLVFSAIRLVVLPQLI